MMKKRLFRGGRLKTSTKRKPFPRTLLTNPDRKDTPTTTKVTLDQEITLNEMANTAFTANYRTTPRMNVSNEFVKRNRAETDKAVPTGLECT